MNSTPAPAASLRKQHKGKPGTSPAAFIWQAAGQRLALIPALSLLPPVGTTAEVGALQRSDTLPESIPLASFGLGQLGQEVGWAHKTLFTNVKAPRHMAVTLNATS